MGHELSWVIVGNMLIASHCLLRDLSFNDLDDIGLVEPQPIRLDGRDFIGAAVRPLDLSTGI